MSTDENIGIHVDDDGSLDALIAKLDEALAKSEQLTGQTGQTPEQAQFYTIPSSEMANINKPYMNAPDFAAFYRNLDKQGAAAKQNADNIINEEGEQIKGLENASSRVIRMIPGLREAQRIQRGLGALSEGSIMGVMGLLMVAYSIYRQISAYLEEQKRQQAEFKKTIMGLQGFTTSAEFTAWQTGQRQAIEGYRSGIIP